jgi:hypothetical protein
MAGKPGRSGRKKADAAKINFNTKIDPGLRDYLQAEADKHGRSLSREIELRLRRSIKPANETDEVNRALCFLIAEADRMISRGEQNWRNDWNLWDAFGSAVRNILIMGRRPKGGRIAFEHPLFESSLDLANAVAFRIADALVTADDKSADNGTQYSYPQAAKVLGKPVRWWKHLKRERAIRSNPEMQALEKFIKGRLAAALQHPPSDADSSAMARAFADDPEVKAANERESKLYQQLWDEYEQKGDKS